MSSRLRGILTGHRELSLKNYVVSGQRVRLDSRLVVGTAFGDQATIDVGRTVVCLFRVADLRWGDAPGLLRPALMHSRQTPLGAPS
jgi:hypothetical protein